MIEQIRVAFADIGISQLHVYLERLRRHPLAVAVIAAVLGYLADIDFRVEVGGKGFAVVAGVAVDDVEIFHLAEIMFGGVGGEDSRDSRVETAAEDGREAGFLEAFTIGPLPRIFKMSLVFRLIIGRVEIVDAADETGVHDCEVLIRQRHVDDHVGFMTAEELDELVDTVGIDGVCRDIRRAYGLGDGVAFGLCARREHDFSKNFGVLGALVCDDRADPSGTDDDYFRHFLLFGLFYVVVCYFG